MAAAAGKLSSLLLLLLLLLLMALLAAFAATSVARSHPTEIIRAFGVGVGRSDACCMCACTKLFPVAKNKCVCGGKWSGECPSVCNNCQCDEENTCTCQDGSTIWYNDCMSVSCPSTGAAAAGGARITQR